MGKLAGLLRRPCVDPEERLEHARDVGRRLAEDGAGVGEALRTLRTEAQVRGREPLPGEVEALVEGWADTTLGHLHRLTCEDPLTGLATMAHLRTRVAEQRRAGLDPARAHALVVVTPGGQGGDRPAHDVPVGAAGPASPGPATTGVLGRALSCAALGERVRVVFGGGETVAHTHTGRIVVLADRDRRLQGLAALLHRLLDEDGWAADVRVHPLPEGELELVLLLERLDLGQGSSSRPAARKARS